MLHDDGDWNRNEAIREENDDAEMEAKLNAEVAEEREQEHCMMYECRSDGSALKPCSRDANSDSTYPNKFELSNNIEQIRIKDNPLRGCVEHS